MSVFNERLEKLNNKQREAVENIDGPVLVIAGPGTGKTELLSIRTANILLKTDINPSNILLLTFTDSASYNMRDRLIGLIGEQAYRIGIYTFHSFATDILNKYPEYFFDGAKFSPATEIDQINIIENIVKNLPRKNPLSSRHPELGYVYIKDIISAIKDLKKNNLTPEKFEKKLLENKKYYKELKNIFDSLEEISNKRKYSEIIPTYLGIYKKLEKLKENEIAKIICNKLGLAIAKSSETEKSTPLTEWKNEFVKKVDNKFILKDLEEGRQEKLESLLGVYTEYESELYKRALFDFEDMIIKALEAFKNNQNLKADLQERYQYVMIDEFQDTNQAQLDLVLELVKNDSNNDRPNILAVGDDDQAIYKFQGAEINNLKTFAESFNNTLQIVLDKNYRSTQQVLNFARAIIKKAEDRLETRNKEITKELESKNLNLKSGEIIIKKFENDTYEYNFIGQELQKLIKSGIDAKEIAIICRKHEQLKELADKLNNFQIPYSYEKRENVLKKQHIIEIITILKFVHLYSENGSEELLPEILSFNFWELSRLDIWKIGEQVRKGVEIETESEKKWQRVSWLQAMIDGDNLKIKQIANFLIELISKSKSTPLEFLIDEIIGTTEYLWEDSEHDDGIFNPQVFPGDLSPGKTWGFVSPFKSFYFNNQKFQHNKPEYLDFLFSLRTFIGALREFKGGEVLYAKDILEFVEIYNGNNLTLSVISPFASSLNSVSLLTAHKAKGLEFEYVFLLSVDDEVWRRGQVSSKISFPINMKLKSDADNDDDKIRLLYVALTRAKHTLYLTHNFHKVRYLADENSKEEDTPTEISKEIVQSLEIKPKNVYLEDEKILLKRLLENYKMPITHLNNFLNFTKVGPEKFIEQNLLRFPQALTPSSAYGSAMHSAIEKYFLYYNKFQKLQNENDVFNNFENALLRARLPENEFKKYLESGQENLEIYLKDLKKRKILPNTKVEVKFASEGCLIGEVPATGNIDKMEFIDGNELIVTDLKTGDAMESFEENGLNDYKKIKLHFFKYQLAYYALLIESSRTYSNYKIKVGNIEFLEKDKNDKIIILPFVIDNEIKERVKILANTVYKKIQNLDFPDTSNYPQNIKGILQFEEDLLNS